jgi:hypothetical protein
LHKRQGQVCGICRRFSGGHTIGKLRARRRRRDFFGRDHVRRRYGGFLLSPPKGRLPLASSKGQAQQEPPLSHARGFRFGHADEEGDCGALADARHADQEIEPIGETGMGEASEMPFRCEGRRMARRRLSSTARRFLRREISASIPASRSGV